MYRKVYFVTLWYCMVLYCIALYCIVLHCIELYRMVSYVIQLHCTLLHAIALLASARGLCLARRRYTSLYKESQTNKTKNKLVATRATLYSSNETHLIHTWRDIVSLPCVDTYSLCLDRSGVTQVKRKQFDCNKYNFIFVKLIIFNTYTIDKVSLPCADTESSSWETVPRDPTLISS